MVIVGGGDGKCVAEFEVAEEHLNEGGGLHGGFTATAVDVISTLALMTKDDAVPGVSVDIHVSYLRSARKGEVVVIEADTIKTGRNLAFLECVLKHKKDGSVIAKGSHTKYVG